MEIERKSFAMISADGGEAQGKRWRRLLWRSCLRDAGDRGDRE